MSEKWRRDLLREERQCSHLQEERTMEIYSKEKDIREGEVEGEE